MSSRKPTVLVVEDHQDSRDMIYTFLTGCGYEVMEAADGQTGVYLARTTLPSLILIDLNLPILDGSQATIRLKADSVTENIPIIAVSANCDDPHIKDKALRAGCEDCIAKPLDLRHLLKIVEGYFSRADPAAPR